MFRGADCQIYSSLSRLFSAAMLSEISRTCSSVIIRLTPSDTKWHRSARLTLGLTASKRFSEYFLTTCNKNNGICLRHCLLFGRRLAARLLWCNTVRVISVWAAYHTGARTHQHTHSTQTHSFIPSVKPCRGKQCPRRETEKVWGHFHDIILF